MPLNDYQNKLYNDLTALVKKPEIAKNKRFYSKILISPSVPNIKYLLFNYRVCKYAHWCEPSALEARGIMFRIDNQNTPINLACLPPEKFFNWYENQMTSIDLENKPELIDQITVKEDGSLISTYVENDSLKLKTKASLDAVQALGALKYLEQDKNKKFYKELLQLTIDGYTINMEYTSPRNQIVLEYLEDKLTVFSIRSRIDGTYLTYQNLMNKKKNFPEIIAHYVKRTSNDLYNQANGDSQKYKKLISQFLQTYKMKHNIEGYVIRLKTGKQLKIKTDWYFARHRIQTKAVSNEEMYKAAINNTSDDLKSTYQGKRPDLVARIEYFEEFTLQLIDDLIERFDDFVLETKKINFDPGSKDYKNEIKNLASEKFPNQFERGLAMRRWYEDKNGLSRDLCDDYIRGKIGNAYKIYKHLIDEDQMTVLDQKFKSLMLLSDKD